MANALTQYEIPASIAQRLSALRSRITLWFVIDGVGRVLLAALAIFAVDLLLDWTFRLDRSLRGVMWILMAGVILLVLWRRLLAPLSSPIGDDALLLEVERKHKDLGESVISAAQFARISDLDRLGVSRSMVDATIEHGVRQADRIDFSDVLNSKRFGWNVGLLLLGIGLSLALGAGVAMGGPLSIWFNRNILLGDARWPQDTYLEIVGAEDGIVTLPRGENWTQLVRVVDDSQVPDTVFVDFFPSRGRPSQSMKKLPSGDFEVVFTNVIEEFQFRARGGDAVTDPVQVRLVEPPAVKELSLEVTPPPYAGSTTESLPSGKGPYYVLKGSRLAIAGKANKPLSKVELVIERPAQGADLSPPVRVPLTLSTDDAFQGEVSAEQLEPGKYLIELTDAGGLTSKRPTSFALALKTDRPPRFAAARLIGVSGMVVPQARVPYAAKVLDDFAVTKLSLGYRWRGESSDAGDTGASEPGTLAGILPAPAVDVEDAFDVQKLNLQPGSSITLFLEATDNDNISGPNVGKSPDFLLRVVTEEQLRTDLLRREKEQRQEFERLLKNQEDLIVDVAALAAAAGDAADFTDEQRLTLMQLQKRQNLVATNSAGVANVLDAITAEVINNRLEEAGGKLESRLREKIIAPMRKIATVDVDRAILSLERARRVAQNPSERAQALQQAQAAQQQIVVTMKDILANMAKAEGYQEAINLLYELEKAQKEVLEKTEQEKKDRIKRILGGEKAANAAAPDAGDSGPSAAPSEPAKPAAESPQP